MPNIPTLSIGAKPLKSYFDWKVNAVKPMKITAVHNKACKTIVLFSKVEMTAPEIGYEKCGVDIKHTNQLLRLPSQ